MMTLQTLLEKLGREGGCLVATADCDQIEIADANARGDMYVDANGFGFVRRCPEWLQRHSRFARNATPDCCDGPLGAAASLARTEEIERAMPAAPPLPSRDA